MKKLPSYTIETARIHLQQLINNLQSKLDGLDRMECDAERAKLQKYVDEQLDETKCRDFTKDQYQAFMNFHKSLNQTLLDGAFDFYQMDGCKEALSSQIFICCDLDSDSKPVYPRGVTIPAGFHPDECVYYRPSCKATPENESVALERYETGIKRLKAKGYK